MALKTVLRDSGAHVVFQPTDFLAVLVPRPRVNLTRLNGVFALNSRDRAQITSAGRGREGESPGSVEPHRA